MASSSSASRPLLASGDFHGSAAAFVAVAGGAAAAAPGAPTLVPARLPVGSAAYAAPGAPGASGTDAPPGGGSGGGGGAAGAAGAGRRLLQVCFEPGEGFRNVSLLEGMTREDIASCLRTAAGLSSHEDFLLYDDSDEALVPVSAALPSGIRLHLRCVERPSPDGEARRSPAVAAKSPGAVERTAATKQMAENTEAMMRFSKIANYLANDRTFLAWTRTSLAIGRTTFTIAALTAATDGWLAALNTVTVSLAVLSVLFFITGSVRFADVRGALDKNHPPKYMLSRLTEDGSPIFSIRRMGSVHSLLFATVLVISVAAATKNFSK